MLDRLRRAIADGLPAQLKKQFLREGLAGNRFTQRRE